MDPIPFADPVRIKTAPRDDMSTETGMAGALAAFLSVLGKVPSTRVSPEGQVRSAGPRADTAVTISTGLPIPFAGNSSLPVAGRPEHVMEMAPPLVVEAEGTVLSDGALSANRDGGSDAAVTGIAMPVPSGQIDLGAGALLATVEVRPAAGNYDRPAAPSPLSTRTGPTSPVGGETAGDIQGVGSGARGLAPVTEPAETQIERREDGQPNMARRDEGPWTNGPSSRIGERISTSYTVTRTDTGGVLATPLRDRDAQAIPARAAPAAAMRQISMDGAGDGIHSDQRAVAVRDQSPPPDSIAETHRPLVTSATPAGRNSAATQGSRPVEAPAPVAERIIEPPRGLPTATEPTRPSGGPGAGAAVTAAIQTGSSIATATVMEDIPTDHPTTGKRGAGAPSEAEHGRALSAPPDAEQPPPVDAKFDDFLTDGGDPVAATVDAPPLARGVERATAVHAATGHLPIGLGHRLAEAITQFPDRPVEITLSPDELGKVRLTLATHDGALTMMIQADRPDTLDLLRRNIDTLAKDLRDLGYQDLTFSFGQERDPRQNPAPDAPPRGAEDQPVPSLSAREATGPDWVRPDATGGGLDLRL